MIKRDCKKLTSTTLQNMKTRLNGSIPFEDNHLKALSLSLLYKPNFTLKSVVIRIVTYRFINNIPLFIFPEYWEDTFFSCFHFIKLQKRE